jgi:hypothetical protein
VAEEEWCAAGTGLRQAISWHSCVKRCAGFTESDVGVSSSPAILRGSTSKSSATDDYRSASNHVRMPRRTRGSSSVH